MTYKNKTTFALLAIVAISIPVAFAAIPAGTSFEDFCAIKAANTSTSAADFICELDIFQMKSDIEKLQSSVYEVKTIETALTGERFDFEARCDPGDALLGDYVSYIISPVAEGGYLSGTGPLMDDSPGNATRSIQVGWYGNLNNRDNISTTFPITGEVSILCIQHP